MTRKITIKNEGLTPYEPVDPLTLNREGKRARPLTIYTRALRQWPIRRSTTTTERAK